MKENKLFNIQHNQVNAELANIQWIADNPQKLIRALRAKVAEENTAYLSAQSEINSPACRASNIFRGQYMREWVHTYVTCAIDWEKDAR